MNLPVGHEHVRKTVAADSQERRRMSRMMSAASAAVAVSRVEAACTSPDSRSTFFWIVSSLPAVVGSLAVWSTPIIPLPRREGSGGGWRGPRGLPSSAFVRSSWHVKSERGRVLRVSWSAWFNAPALARR